MLRLTDVHLYYGHVHAVKGITMEVPEGEIVTLIGANGAGKSSTLKAISSVHRIGAGSVELAGLPSTFFLPTRSWRQEFRTVPRGVASSTI